MKYPAAALALSLTLAPALAATDPGLAGPFAVATVSVSIPASDGATLPADLYYPTAGGGVFDPAASPAAAVTFAHGFSRNRSRYTDFGSHLASRGFVVVIADYRCSFFGCPKPQYAEDVRATLDWVLARNADPASPLYRNVRVRDLGASGHSAGGLAALLAASRDPRIRAVAPMDPVDDGGIGARELPNALAPVAIPYSEPSSCNASGSAEDLYAAAPAQRRGTKLVGANHCDPEKNNDVLGCALTCGSWDAERHQRYLRYVTGWFEYFLDCDSSYGPWVLGAHVEADLTAGRITYDADWTPRAPSAVSASYAPGGVTVRRDPPSQCAGIDSWTVERRIEGSATWSTVAAGLSSSATEWLDATAEPNRTYVYRVRDVVSDFRAIFPGTPSPEITVSTSTLAPGPVNSITSVVRAAGTALEVSFSPAACATNHTAYWGTSVGPLPGPAAWTGQACNLGTAGSAATFDPGAIPSGTLLYFVVVGEDGAAEGSYGASSSGAERPQAAGLGPCDRPQNLGGC